MKRLSSSVLLLVVLAFASRAARADLEGDLRAVLRDKFLAKVSVGVCIAQLPANGPQAQVLFEQGSTAPLMPASNQKVLTTAAALDHFGAEFKFRTLLVQRGQDLILVGDGDPTFGDRELLQKVGWDADTVYSTWAQELKKANFTSFRNVLVDDSVFDTVFTHPNWEARQLGSAYAAPIAGMTLNTACVDFLVKGGAAGQKVSYATFPPTRYVTVLNTCMVGRENAVALHRLGEENKVTLRGTLPRGQEVWASVPIHDPARYAATVLAETLRTGGINISGNVDRDRSARARVVGPKPEAGYTLLAVHETSILQAIARANKDSQNLYAESLFKRLGASASGQSGSWKNGAAAMVDFLGKAGADVRALEIADGCGLSRQNRVTAQTIARVLGYMFASKHRETFISSLAQPGEEGTLRKRFAGVEVRQRIFAKSGYINNVSALSGYLKGKDGHWYAFSILMNGIPNGSNTRAKELQEAIVKALDKSTQ